MTEPQTFFHIGYARAASTFLQKRVFPALRGIQYIPRNRFRVRESQKRRFRADKVLMSREAGEFIYERCDDVLRIFNSKIIISVRRHDKLAASLYRLQVKNGHTLRFPQFLDVAQDRGTQKVNEFEFMQLVRYVEEKTGEPPLLLIFEDYLSDPDFYLASLCAFLQCEIDHSQLDSRPVHSSYSDKQLLLRRQLRKRVLTPEQDWRNMTRRTIEDHHWRYTLKHRLVLWYTGIFMRLARFAPQAWLNDEPLIELQELDKVRLYYAADWQACRQFVEQQSVRLGVQRSA